ncbi:hypothetical protein CTEN210_01473 [Chaetoceros tenuissimus]|uniref:Uncharacterized protein n=1 Tax=Chaetoceros tenuissimus TaxID=426638 RepID=A0AAD3CHN1_9STRA|nr:hypothetical protein CTEN210_01473 [Chaetoceros tenuissimus]
MIQRKSLYLFLFGLAAIAIHQNKGHNSKPHLSALDEKTLESVGEIIESIQSLDGQWPKYDYNQVFGQDGNMRRRLLEDNWSKEENEMREEIETFFKSKMKNHKLMEGKTTGVQSIDTSSNPKRIPKKRKLQNEDFPDATPNCTVPDITGTEFTLPCPSETIHQKCDKYNNGVFSECLNLCRPSFCCTHDAANNPQAPTCKDEPNCRNYIPCYIVWWKLEDTVGPHDRALLPLSFLEKFPKTNFPNFFDWNNQDYRRDIDDINQEEFWDQVKARFLNYAYDDDIEEADFENPENWQRVLDGQKLVKHAD